MRAGCRAAFAVALLCGLAVIAPRGAAATGRQGARAATLAAAQGTLSVAPSSAEPAAWRKPCTVPGTADPMHVVLDGKTASPDVRKTVLAKLERCAQAGNVMAQSFIGALYWMGDALPDALVDRDPTRAITYLRNAAAHGDITDMAKLAEIELAENHPEAAWIWAHLFGHYALRRGQDETQRGDDGYAADLVVRTDANLGPTQRQSASGDAAAFLAYYGPGITAYQTWMQLDHGANPDASVQHAGHLHFPQRDTRPSAGIADFLVEVRLDGTVAHAWDIDAYPFPTMARLLRPLAARTRFAPGNRHGPRFVVVPVVYNDLRYTVHRHG